MVEGAAGEDGERNVVLDGDARRAGNGAVAAADGEVGTECTEASFSVNYRALPVFRPLP